jgi:hypothetical protein
MNASPPIHCTAGCRLNKGEVGFGKRRAANVSFKQTPKSNLSQSEPRYSKEDRECWLRHVTGRRQRLQSCALQAANGMGAGQKLPCVQAPHVIVGCRLQRAKRGGLQRGGERRQPAACFASQLSSRALQRPPHWHVTGTSSGSLMSHVTCNASRASRHPSRQRQRLFALQHARGGVSLSSAFPQQHIKFTMIRRHFRSIADEIGTTGSIAPLLTCFIYEM